MNFIIRFFKLVPLSLLLIFYISGCSIQPKITKHIPKIDRTIPVISDIRWLGDMNAIALEWSPNHDLSIVGYNIYRRLKQDKNGTFIRVAKIDDRFTSHYVDKYLPQNSEFYYNISAFNDKNLESFSSKNILAITRSTLQSVVYIDALNKLPRKAKLIWRPHVNERVNGYILERKTPIQNEWHVIATLRHRLIAEYIDNDLEDNQVYLYRLRAVTFDEIKSMPSAIVKIITKALPATIKGVKISTSLPNSIDISWLKSLEKDIKMYRIYRNETAQGKFKLRAQVINPKFKDKIKKNSKSYYYKISAVDFDGLESENFTVYYGKTLSRPTKVLLHTADFNNGHLILKWKKTDKRTTLYRIIKKEKLGWFKTKKSFITTKKTTYKTVQKPNISITYSIIAVDKYGIESIPVVTEDLIYEKIVQ